MDVYGEAGGARWLSPAMDRVPDVDAMRLVLQQWIAEDARLISPAGRWAIELREDHRLVGGAVLLPLPPGNEDLEMGWQLNPQTWGRRYATEAGRARGRGGVSRGFDRGRPGGRGPQARRG